MTRCGSSGDRCRSDSGTYVYDTENAHMLRYATFSLSFFVCYFFPWYT